MYFVDKGWLSEDSLKDLCSQWGFKLKNLYRQNYILPYTYESGKCKATKNDIYNSRCGFTCVEEKLDGMIDAMKDMLSSHFGDDFSDKHWEKVRDFICNGDAYKTFYGDHLESASAADPSFWPVHPTGERFLQARLAASTLTGDWYSDYQNDWVCGRPECVLTETGSPDLQYDAQCCLGHFENDGFLDFVSADKRSTFGMSNKDQLKGTHPGANSYTMPYIYDSFTWSHCASESCPHSECDVDATLLGLYNENNEGDAKSSSKDEEEENEDEDEDEGDFAFSNYN